MPDVTEARAVLVGIDDYPFGTLTGPADDAVRFARFFAEHGVPAGRITLLLATSQVPEGVPAGAVVRSADRQILRDVFLTELPALSASRLYVVWGGHGHVDVARNRRLRYPTARLAEAADLDVDSLLATYASDLAPGLHRQVWLIDACQIAKSTSGHETFRSGDPVPGRAQDILFAAGIGQAATNLRVRRTGVFSREVLRLVEAAGIGLLDRPAELASTLRERFERLADGGLTSQTPTYLWHRNLLGDGAEVHFRQAVRATTGRVGPRELSAAAHALITIPEFLRPQDRDEIVTLLPITIAATVRRQSGALPDAVATLRACLSHTGGLAELVEAVRVYASDPAAMERFEAAVKRLEELVGDR
jgi:hypothetical protein